MTIQFDQIPAGIRKPGKYFEFNTKLAVRTLPGNEQKVLICAQRLPEGSVAALTPVQVFSDAQAAQYFGPGSMAHLMVRAAITANPYLDLTVVALNDLPETGYAAGTVTITTEEEAGKGTLILYVGSRKIEVAISDGDSGSAVAAAIVSGLDRYPDLPVTAARNVNVVTLTAKNSGSLGNAIPVAAACTAAGVTVDVTPMAGGAGDPDLALALTKAEAGQYQVIVSPYHAGQNADVLWAYLDRVSGPLEQRPGIGVIAWTGALAAATTLAETINHGRVTLALLRGTRSLPWELAAAYGAVIAGELDPARPLNTLELPGIHAPAIDQRLTRTEQEVCLHNGVTPIEVTSDGKVRIVRAVSTYTRDPEGNDDVSLLDITTIRTLDYVRKACRERIALRFPREKLSSKTPPKVRSELLDVLKRLEELEIVEEVDANKDGLVVERNAADANRLDARIPADVVNGLHVFAGRIDLLL